MKVQSGEQRYGTTLSLTSALNGGGCQRHARGAFSAIKRPSTHCYSRLGGPPFRSERVRKTSPPPGLDPRTVQPIASRYTDYPIPAHV